MSHDTESKADDASTNGDTQADAGKPAVKFRSKKLNKSTARAATVLDSVDNNDDSKDDSSSIAQSIEQLRELQQYRAAQPVIQHTAQSKPKAAATKGNNDAFEGSIDEKLKIQQMNAYIESQLRAQNLLQPAQNTDGTVNSTQLYKQQLYAPDSTVLDKLSAATVANSGREAEKGYNWLAGIAEVELSESERAAVIARNEAMKRKLEQEQVEAAQRQVGDVAVNFNSNYAQHKKEYVENKKAKRDTQRQVDSKQ